ncbi:MAG: TonB-dependent receptor [Acidobacteria bacterium]|nr:TonB-dependent receptor [Acidobacteriota bacterium]
MQVAKQRTSKPAQQPAGLTPSRPGRVPGFLVLLTLLLAGATEVLGQTPRNPAPQEGTQRTAPNSQGEGQNAARVNGAQTSTPSSPGQINESQLVGLPLNGRSYSQLTTLQSGVSDPSSSSASRGTGGGGLTVSGGRASSNIFSLDGTNIMDAANQVPRSAAGVQLGSDAVLQVQVFSSAYAAEYGRGSGGVLNSITRSGTPQVHGNLFEYLRNSAMDARNFFDPGPEPTPFKRNQFGFTVTGPLVKERTFFMGSFEALKDRLTYNNQDYVPDVEARQGIITNAAGQEIRRVPVDPRMVPYLALYPLPNQIPHLGNGIAQNAASQFLPTNESFFTARVDHKISERDGLFVRYTFDDATSHSFQPAFSYSNRSESRQQYITLVESHIFSLRTLHSLRLGYTRPVTTRHSVLSLASIPYPEIPRNLYFVPDAPQFGRLEVPGLTQIGPDPQQPEGNVMNTFQLADDLVMQRGSHAWKVGLQVHRYRWDPFSSWNKSAVWSFNSLESFLRAGPESTSLQVALPGSENRVAYRQTYLGLYLQDEYKLSPRLQINTGLRYDFTALIHEDRGRTAFLPDPARDTQAQVGPFAKDNPALLNFSPRLGITWSPWQNRNTVFSAGLGIFYDQMLEYLIEQRKSTAPFYKVAIKPNFDSSQTFPKAALAAEGTPLLAQVLDYAHISNPMVLRYNFTIQQPLPGGWRAQVAYVGARGNHLFRSYEANLLPLPVTQPDGSLFFPPYNPKGPDNRVNPAFGGINILSSDAQSFYNSLQVSANKNLSHGLSLQASYTFSKSIDDASSHSSDTEGVGQYGGSRTAERGFSSFNIRHRLTANYFYTLPLGSGQHWWNSGLLAGLFGGWRVGGIFSLRTGTPFTPSINVRTPGYLFAAIRPHLLPGRSNNPTSGVSEGCAGVPAGKELAPPALVYDPCVFSVPSPGTLGNLGRNTVIAPSAVNMDVSVQRDFAVDAKRRLQFRAEFFNILNHPNFNSSTSTEVIVFSGASGQRSSAAGRTHTTTTTARQLQFALRISF